MPWLGSVVSALTALVNRITTRPLWSMSDGVPKAAVSTGMTSVSMAVANAPYSVSVNPPAGLVVSETMMAVLLMAAMRAVVMIGLVQYALALTLSCTRSPTLALDVICWASGGAPATPAADAAARAAAVEFADHCCCMRVYQARAPATYCGISRRSRSRSACSKA